jgi:hypothetical protein
VAAAGGRYPKYAKLENASTDVNEAAGGALPFCPWVAKIATFGPAGPTAATGVVVGRRSVLTARHVWDDHAAAGGQLDQLYAAVPDVKSRRNQPSRAIFFNRYTVGRGDVIAFHASTDLNIPLPTVQWSYDPQEGIGRGDRSLTYGYGPGYNADLRRAAGTLHQLISEQPPYTGDNVVDTLDPGAVRLGHGDSGGPVFVDDALVGIHVSDPPAGSDDKFAYWTPLLNEPEICKAILDELEGAPTERGSPMKRDRPSTSRQPSAGADR